MLDAARRRLRAMADGGCWMLDAGYLMLDAARRRLRAMVDGGCLMLPAVALGLWRTGDA